MSRDTIAVLVCDRCRQRVELRDPGQEQGWGVILANAPNPDSERPNPRTIGDVMRADMCPPCADELFAWWTTPPADRSTSAPLPAPVRLKITSKQRSELVARVITMLKEQVSSSIDVVKEEPTSILSTEIIPGAFEGIDIRAHRLVKDLLKGLC